MQLEINNHMRKLILFLLLSCCNLSFFAQNENSNNGEDVHTEIKVLNKKIRHISTSSQKASDILKQHTLILSELNGRVTADSALLEKMLLFNKSQSDSIISIHSEIKLVRQEQDFNKSLMHILLCVVILIFIVIILILYTLLRKLKLRNDDIAIKEIDNLSTLLKEKFSIIENAISELSHTPCVPLDQIYRYVDEIKKSNDSRFNEIRELINDISIKNNQESSIQEDIDVPPVERYNNAVYHFTKINGHISEMRKSNTKNLIILAYKYLTCKIDKNSFVFEVKESGIINDDKLQFYAIADNIENFIIRDKPIIDHWLAANHSNNIHDYLSAIRMPLDELFDADLDRDIFDDECDGQRITMVYKLGYHFPGNTIDPFRKKSLTSC